MIKQKRIVNDAFTMLGEVGGLYDFFYAGLSFLTALFSSRLLTISQVTSLFQVTSSDRVMDSVGSFSTSEQQHQQQPLQLSTCDTVLHNLTLGWLPKGSKRRVLRRGAKTIERHLDMMTLIKQARASQALSRLLLSSKSRSLLHL